MGFNRLIRRWTQAPALGAWSLCSHWLTRKSLKPAPLSHKVPASEKGRNLELFPWVLPPPSLCTWSILKFCWFCFWISLYIQPPLPPKLSPRWCKLPLSFACQSCLWPPWHPSGYPPSTAHTAASVCDLSAEIWLTCFCMELNGFQLVLESSANSLICFTQPFIDWLHLSILTWHLSPLWASATWNSFSSSNKSMLWLFPVPTNPIPPKPGTLSPSWKFLCQGMIFLSWKD